MKLILPQAAQLCIVFRKDSNGPFLGHVTERIEGEKSGIQTHELSTFRLVL